MLLDVWSLFYQLWVCDVYNMLHFDQEAKKELLLSILAFCLSWQKLDLGSKLCIVSWLIQVDGDIPTRVKRNAHEMILDFIRSRPPLKPVSGFRFFFPLSAFLASLVLARCLCRCLQRAEVMLAVWCFCHGCSLHFTIVLSCFCAIKLKVKFISTLQTASLLSLSNTQNKIRWS